MASLLDLGTIANDGLFQSRCTQAAVDAAIAVTSESSGTANHVQRVQYAIAVINGAVNQTSIARAVLSNATIAAEANIANITTDCSIPDGDIQFAVNSIFNALAGVTT